MRVAFGDALLRKCNKHPVLDALEVILQRKVSVGRSFSFAASEIPPLTLQRTFFRRFEGIQFVKFLRLKLICLYHLHYTKHNS